MWCDQSHSFQISHSVSDLSTWQFQGVSGPQAPTTLFAKQRNHHYLYISSLLWKYLQCKATNTIAVRKGIGITRPVIYFTQYRKPTHFKRAVPTLYLTMGLSKLSSSESSQGSPWWPYRMQRRTERKRHFSIITAPKGWCIIQRNYSFSNVRALWKKKSIVKGSNFPPFSSCVILEQLCWFCKGTIILPVSRGEGLLWAPYYKDCNKMSPGRL